MLSAEQHWSFGCLLLRVSVWGYRIIVTFVPFPCTWDPTLCLWMKSVTWCCWLTLYSPCITVFSLSAVADVDEPTDHSTAHCSPAFPRDQVGQGERTIVVVWTEMFLILFSPAGRLRKNTKELSQQWCVLSVLRSRNGLVREIFQWNRHHIWKHKQMHWFHSTCSLLGPALTESTRRCKSDFQSQFKACSQAVTVCCVLAAWWGWSCHDYCLA